MVIILCITVYSIVSPIHLYVEVRTTPSLGWPFTWYWGFPGSSAGKESTCNPEDPGWILGSGRSSGEGIGYSIRGLQYSWASLVAQTIKSPPAMQETWVRPLGLEDPLEQGTATHSSILAWRIPWTEEPDKLQSMVTKLDTTKRLSLSEIASYGSMKLHKIIRVVSWSDRIHILIRRDTKELTHSAMETQWQDGCLQTRKRYLTTK